ncbi:MAG: flagellar biosynthetic protein FliO [Proteobacteria bacterium]|uniref:FliO/MopB family protein n=1 Tax=Aquabacterium sp. TaxID=1872578 RepID=UPI0035C789AB|nr:flagellar biosynthetic protein FliO [Pseudomonadota bacterium]
MAASGMSVVWFVLIVALIPLSLWVLKRSGLATGAVAGARAQALIKPVGQYNLGPGQRLVTVEVGQGEDRTWLVLGVTGQHIQTLHTLPPQAPVEAATPAVHPGFAALLKRAGMGVDKGGDKGNDQSSGAQ